MDFLNDSLLQSNNVNNINFIKNCHSDWQEILIQSLQTMDQNYLQQLMYDKDWLPGKERLFAAFSLPLAKTRYILLGESPYPRIDSANGYAFWDNAVSNLWALKGLSTLVNRATSLRNLIKMLLIARGDIDTKASQENIALVNKSTLVQTAEQLFIGMMNKGILLLNATLVYSEDKVPYHARHWKPFMQTLFSLLARDKSNIQLILLGKIAETVSQDKLSIGLMAEHPYNISFITNQHVLDFFKPLDLLKNE